jgi:AhpC/TSA family
MPRTIFAGIVPLLLLAGTGSAAQSKMRVVIFDGVATEVAARPGDSNDLWVSSADLTKATRFELKPQGVCSEQQCYPIPAGRENDFLAESQGTTWFNLGEFARQLRLPAAHDLKHDVWCFGPRPEMQNGYVESLIAPDFRLADVDGKKHSLSDFRGKKVLLITWASW